MYHDSSLQIRAMGPLDGERIFELVAEEGSHNPPVLPWMPLVVSPRTGRELIEVYRRRFRQRKAAMYGVFCEGALIGTVGLNDVLRRESLTIGNFGYWIARVYRRRGFGFEACWLYIEQLRCMQPEIDALMAATSESNLASQRLLEKLGFERLLVSFAKRGKEPQGQIEYRLWLGCETPLT